MQPTIKTIVLKKKNRKYFAATVNGYKCKLIIDENSKDLELKPHSLTVNDLTVRTKYGTDIIFELAGSKEEGNNVCTFKHSTYNEVMVDRCRKLGGVYERGVWVFPSIVEEEVEELDFIYNSELVTVDLTALDTFYHTSATFLGYTIVRSFGKKEKSVLGDNVSMVSGDFSSGGSYKNFGVWVESGSEFRLQVPKELLENKELLEKEETEWAWSVKQ